MSSQEQGMWVQDTWNPELPNLMGESLEESVLFLISFAGDSDVQNLRMTIKEGSKITMRMC